MADHCEVFTPARIVEATLDLAKGETERIDSRFLEPACGNGYFLVRILRRKLAAAELKYGKSDFEKRHFALLELMYISCVKVPPDNVAECRDNPPSIFTEHLELKGYDAPYQISNYVLSQNLAHDALTMQDSSKQPIAFAEWSYLRKGKFQRRDCRFDAPPHSWAFSAQDSVFAYSDKHAPVKIYPALNSVELAGIARGSIGG